MLRIKIHHSPLCPHIVFAFLKMISIPKTVKYEKVLNIKMTSCFTTICKSNKSESFFV